ncbi:MAG: hypothetical protein R2781_01665 [Flavobacteriaceae bacterium]
MKRLIAFFLLLSFMAPIGGTLLWFNIEQKGLHKELKKRFIAGVQVNELTLFVLSEEEIKTKLDWKHSKEFTFDGVMYDIVKRKFENGSHYLWCWKDHKETQLYKKLEHLVATALGKNSQQNQKQCQLKLFYHTLFFKEITPWSPSYLMETISTKNNYFTQPYTSLKPIPNTPPPLFVS